MTSKEVSISTFATHFCLINTDSQEVNVTHIARETLCVCIHRAGVQNATQAFL